jgi:hypothetical protein
MKASGCIDPQFLDLSTSWRWVVNFTPRPLYSRERAPGTHCIGGSGFRVYINKLKIGNPGSISGRGSCDCCIFILCRVFIVCVVLCAVFRLIVVLFCVMCVICVLCLTVVPLPPGENPFAVKINNKKYSLHHHIHGCQAHPVTCPVNMWTLDLRT